MSVLCYDRFDKCPIFLFKMLSTLETWEGRVQDIVKHKAFNLLELVAPTLQGKLFVLKEHVWY